MIVVRSIDTNAIPMTISCFLTFKMNMVIIIRIFFFSHNDCVSSRDDPREDPDYIQPPKPRTVELLRDPLKGFGFVAGSEKPVIVRFVTDGKSVGKWLTTIVQLKDGFMGLSLKSWSHDWRNFLYRQGQT